MKSFVRTKCEHKRDHSNLATIVEGVKADGFTIVPAFLDEFELDNLRQARNIFWTGLMFE